MPDPTPPLSPPVTVIALIEREAARLSEAGVAFGHGTTNAFDEAAWLVLWRLGHALDALDEVAEHTLLPAQVAAVSALTDERIRSRRPAAYLTGEAWLQGVPFHVDARTIVPRSFIAELIADASIDPWLGAHTHRVLDLCTGNGSLAVLAAMAWPEVVVDGADLSPEALAVARLNVDRHGLDRRITLLESDGLRGLGGRGPYDLVLCNPPYVNATTMAALPAEYRAEPELALAGGADGMDFVRTLLVEAPKVLASEAVLVLEIGNEREHFEAAFPTLDVVWMSTTAGDDQVLLVTHAALRAWAAHTGL